MNYLPNLSKNFFSNWIHNNPFAYLANPLHGDFLQPDFSVDIKEKADAFVVNAELPGVKKENVEVNIDEHQVSISANIDQYDQASNDEKIIQSERYFGSVSRTFYLPTAVDKATSVAQFKNGVLELTLKKIKNNNGNRLEIK